MLARVVRWEGGDPEAVKRTAQAIGDEATAAGGPPEGVPAKSLLLLYDSAGGRALSISLFDSEADYDEGDRTLNEMSPPEDGMGERAAVERYEVAVDLRAEDLGG